jgi:hypothetical protein
VLQSINAIPAAGGNFQLVAGSNVSFVNGPNSIQINATGGGGGGVTSLNSKTGSVSIVGGTGVSVDNTGANIVLNASATAGVVPKIVGGRLSLSVTDPLPASCPPERNDRMELRRKG